MICSNGADVFTFLIDVCCKANRAVCATWIMDQGDRDIGWQHTSLSEYDTLCHDTFFVDCIAESTEQQSILVCECLEFMHRVACEFGAELFRTTKVDASRWILPR